MEDDIRVDDDPLNIDEENLLRTASAVSGSTNRSCK